jgi:hypothetical protein
MPHRNPGGRPPKYNEPSRPVTVTLPESTLRQLELVNPDRGLAIVKLTRQLASRNDPSPRVEIVDVGRQSGLIIVGSCPALSRIPFLHLVEVAPARFLLAIDRDHDFRSLELAIHDLLDEPASLSQGERDFISELLDTIRRLRLNEKVNPAEILLVNLDNVSRISK